MSLGNVSFVALVFVLTNFSCFHCVELLAMPVIYGKEHWTPPVQKWHSREHGETGAVKALSEGEKKVEADPHSVILPPTYGLLEAVLWLADKVITYHYLGDHHRLSFEVQ